MISLAAREFKSVGAYVTEQSIQILVIVTAKGVKFTHSAGFVDSLYESSAPYQYQRQTRTGRGALGADRLMS